MTGSPAPGATVELSFPGRQPEPTRIVPLAAVLTDRSGRQSVRRVGPGNTLKDIPVKLVTLQGASAEVSGPLSSGQLVVVAGAEHFEAGMTVRPQLAQR
jgi:multidrug efflux pump subunit AcrA (membrane-fusion protein)